MAKLTSYTCAKCGGVLNIDSEQELFDCPFCGTAFDMVDFHRKEILSQADICLKRNEFISASNKYGELYSKDPHDFDALIGLILCAGKIPDKEDLVNPRKLIRHDIEGARKAVDKYAGFWSRYPYFEKLNEVLELSAKYQSLVKEKDSIERSLQADIKRLRKPAIYPEALINSQFKKLTDENRKNSDRVNGEIKPVESKLSVLCFELKQLEPDNPDLKPSQMTKTDLETQLEAVSDIVCIKCAGPLVLDKKRKLYECRACGVAYGTSLFGEPNRKAKEAFVREEFSEAAQWYSYMLMLEPSNFEALRGRMLCSVKWTRVSEKAEVTNFTVKKLRSQAEAAFESALDSDKPYFRKYIELADCYKMLFDEELKLKSLRKRRDELVEKRKHVFVDINTDETNYIPIARETITQSINEVESKIEPVEKGLGSLILQKDKICEEIIAFDRKWFIRIDPRFG